MKDTKETKFYVYILRCNDGSYYVGYTENLFERVKRHYQAEGSVYTSKRQPVELVCFLEFSKRSLRHVPFRSYELQRTAQDDRDNLDAEK